MLETIETLQDTALAELAAASDAGALEQWRIAYLGSKGKLKDAMAALKDVPKADKPAYGQRVNAAKQALEAAFEARKGALAGGGGGKASGPRIDVTEPGIALPMGKRHIITRVREEICEVFSRMGFDVADGPEVEDDEHNFIKLNIPPDHPAREPIDNFYVEEPDGARADQGGRPRMLRSQTSTVQIRVLDDAIKRGWGPPLKIVAPGRVYRPDTVDATHSFMFHQIEGLYVDRRVTMVDLRTTLLQFAHLYFGADAEVRLRPSYFPFTEPSAELDMKIALKQGEEPKWIELGGCGLVDPKVFEAVGLDPEQWTGFAFGFGIERIAMGRYGIPDIRLLYGGDVRFLGRV
ncbi:MAG: phenylalanine--tRNA ligase subunit alpha [Phycisphaerales bacterium]|nr:phenylalanine--tRNA ligase subunit alpha [Phycisphaerales bacterium]